MDLDLTAVMKSLALRRPIFHSERDFQHALAWQIQLQHPEAQLRLEPRPRRGVHLDLLVRSAGGRLAVELKYLVAGFDGPVDGELFELPNQAAQDISRHDAIKDILRIEALLADGYADRGATIVLTNDRSYWQPGLRATPIDAAFRIHEGRTLHGSLTWAPHAGRGSTSGRDTPLTLAGTYTCSWRDYAQVPASSGRTTQFRYLLLNIESRAPAPAAINSTPISSAAAPTMPALQPTPALETTAREEILSVARRLAARSADGSFSVSQVIAEMSRAGSHYSPSTIRTHVTSRMCGDAPDHHATTFDDLERLGGGRYRLRPTRS